MLRKLRVAAYAICVRDGQVLLARSPGPGGVPEWVLPGGGTEHGEDPHDTVVREVEEETGYRVEPTALLGVDSLRLTRPSRLGPGRLLRRTVDHHGVRLVYEARVAGGDLRFETGGSTDLAAWQDLTAVPGLTRVPLVDTGLRLWRERPPAGRATPLRGEEG
ncbi:NUDIX hydrolase [Streptomyces sp. NPDC017890]|uniref:NUDIX hydrolase n=1 Tax=Streptomyces sp. NPDC017890 TaxID=3365015 RepID=UPI00379C0DFB